MAWSGFVVLFFHFIFPGAKWAIAINSWLKWAAGLTGLLQAGSLLIAVTLDPKLQHAGEHMLVPIPVALFVSAVNLAAFFIVRAAEQGSKENP